MSGKAPPLRVVEVKSPKVRVRLPQVPLPFTVKATDWPTRAVEGLAPREVIVPGGVATVTDVLADPVQLVVPVAVAMKLPGLA